MAVKTIHAFKQLCERIIMGGPEDQNFMYEDTTILGVCYEDFDNPATQLQLNSGITPTTTPMNVQLNDFIQAFK